MDMRVGVVLQRRFIGERAMDGESWIRAAACGDLADGEALAVAAPDGRTIALFFTDGGYHALDNQCPHMGFPLVRGLVRNGTVTCDWHGRSFDLAGGGCFHSQCDDVRVFETEIRDGSVWIRVEAEADDRREARLRLLWEGLLGDDRWTMSKAIAQLLHGGVPEADIVELVVRHVGRHIASSHDLDAGDDVSRLINGLKVGQRYAGEERLIALAIAARSAAGPAAERNENVPMPPPYDWERTARWVRNFSRDRMGNRIERCLYTAWREGDGERILPLLLECAVEPHFLDFGDSLISLAYLAELQELFGWEQAGELTFNLGAKLIGQPRQEPERFRRDAVARMRELQAGLEDAAKTSADGPARCGSHGAHADQLQPGLVGSCRRDADRLRHSGRPALCGIRLGRKGRLPRRMAVLQQPMAEHPQPAVVEGGTGQRTRDDGCRSRPSSDRGRDRVHPHQRRRPSGQDACGGRPPDGRTAPRSRPRAAQARHRLGHPRHSAHGVRRDGSLPSTSRGAPAPRRPRPLHHRSAPQQQQRLRDAHRKAVRPAGDGR